jgi:Tol biopolymer transport system component
VYAQSKVGKDGLYTFEAGSVDLHLLLGLSDADRQLSFSTDHYFTRDIVSPHWSPDGKQIAFSSALDGSLAVYVMNADGSNSQRLTDKALTAYSPTWSADGQYIAFVVADSGKQGSQKGIYIMHSDGHGVRLLVSARDGGCPAWRPAS